MSSTNECTCVGAWIDVYNAWMGSIGTQTEFWSSLVCVPSSNCQHLYLFYYIDIVCPLPVNLSPHVRQLQKAMHTPCMYLSSYVPYLVKVRPHFRHFYQAVCACNTCMALLFIVFLHHCMFIFVCIA